MHTVPDGFDRIVVQERGSRYIIISWDPPAAANGILINYTVLQAGDVIAATPPNIVQYRVSPLLPFTTYAFSVLACNSFGCVESQEIQSRTLEDGEYTCVWLHVRTLHGILYWLYSLSSTSRD